MIRLSAKVVLLCMFVVGLYGHFQGCFAATDEIKRHIYKIRAGDCVKGSERALTGFLGQGRNGLVTALHGVVGCNNIRALNVAGRVFRNLAIGKVDIDLDAALLVSDAINDFLKSNPAQGFKTSADKTSGIKVIGFPLDLGEHIETENIRIEGTKPIVSLIPPAELEAFAVCKSPDLARTMYSLEGTIRPGESGAPILNDRDQVIKKYGTQIFADFHR